MNNEGPNNREPGPDFEASYDEGLGPDGIEGLVLPPWERRERFGFLNGLYLTVKDVLLTPRQFFHRMPSQVGLAQPLMFAVVLGVTGAFFSWMWALAGSSLQVLVAEDFEEVVRGPLYTFLAFLFSPFTVTIIVFFKAALIHLVLKLVGGDRLGFEATFRVSAYGQAAEILSLIPFCGSILGALWWLAIAIIGLYSIHDTDPWRAMVAVLLPMVLCLGAIGSGVMAIFWGMS